MPDEAVFVLPFVGASAEGVSATVDVDNISLVAWSNDLETPSKRHDVVQVNGTIQAQRNRSTWPGLSGLTDPESNESDGDP